MVITRIDTRYAIGVLHFITPAIQRVHVHCTGSGTLYAAQCYTDIENIGIHGASYEVQYSFIYYLIFIQYLIFPPFLYFLFLSYYTQYKNIYSILSKV